MLNHSNRWQHFKMFAKEHICLVAMCIMFFLFYRELAGGWLTLIILAFLIVYVAAMALCAFGLTQFMQHEKSHTLTKRRIFWFSAFVATPIYFLWLVFSLIPIIQYEIWMLTGLPLVIVTGLTLASLADRWKGRRCFFWSLQIFIYICLLVGGQLMVHLIF